MRVCLVLTVLAVTIEVGACEHMGIAGSLRQGERRQSRRYCGEVSIKSGRVVGCRRGRLETSAVEERLRARAGLFGMTQHNTKIIDHIDLPARFASYSGKKTQERPLCFTNQTKSTSLLSLSHYRYSLPQSPMTLNTSSLLLFSSTPSILF
jgi:hypothetical protein